MTRIRAEAARILSACVLVAALLAVLTACGQTDAQANNEANAAFEQGDYDLAISEYERVSREQPDRPEPVYNSANARYRLEEYEKAQEGLEEALEDSYGVDDEDIAARTQFNLGNVFFQAEEYEQAIEDYKEVLRQDPDNVDAKHNLELALRQIEEQQMEQQQPQQPEPQPRGQGDQPGPPDQPDDEGDEEQEGPDGDREGVGEDPEGEQRGDGSEQESQEIDRPGPNPQQQMTPAEALQFLEAVGQNTDTLQSYLQQQYEHVSPVEKDW